ncbi:MAG: alpha/beta hydrolase [Firmicutes bacterium]|nr:alpha/beta hydrolase [Bacillota bacterium]
MKERQRVCKMKSSNKSIYIITIFIIIILIFGITSEKLFKYIDKNRYKAPGELIEINDYKMHIYTFGKGKKTVVFLHGWGNTSPVADFSKIYHYISSDTKIAVVERAGYGWSSYTKGSRDADTLAKETHTALEKISLKPPYIIIGHSLASLETIRFMQLYTSEVTGAIILDGGGPEYYLKYPPTVSKFDKITPFLRKIGLARLLFYTTNIENNLIANGKLFKLPQIKQLPYSTQDIYRSMALRHGANSNMVNEFRDVQKGIDKIVEDKTQLDIPLIVLTSGNTVKKDIRWEEVQKRMAEDYSSSGEQKTIDGVGHNIHIDVPEKVVENIQILINDNQSRHNSSYPFKNN